MMADNRAPGCILVPSARLVSVFLLFLWLVLIVSLLGRKFIWKDLGMCCLLFVVSLVVVLPVVVLPVIFVFLLI